MLQRFAWAAWIVVSAGGAYAQSHLPVVELKPEVRALVQLRAEVQRSLSTIPNYTCSQTIRRTRLTEKARKLLRRRLRADKKEGATRLRLATDSADRLGLEVAVVDGRELYAWPGGDFEDRPLAEMVGFGTTSTGDFSSHVESIFVSSQAQIGYAGIEKIDDRRVRRYDYTVSALRSGYWIGTPGGRAITAYEGSFWSLETDDELIRVTVEAVDVPMALGVESASTSIDFQIVEIGGQGFLLPAAASVKMVFWNGSEEINETEFHDCRQFGAESDLSFDTPTEESIQQSVDVPGDVLNVPVGVELGVKLSTEISSETSRTGDQVEAILTHDLRHEGDLIAPKGARLLGRVRRLERLGDSSQPYFAVGLQFSHLQVGGTTSPIRAELVRLGNQVSSGDGPLTLNRPIGANIHRSTSHSVLGLTETIAIDEEIGETSGPMTEIETFFVHGATVRLKAGFRMTWRIVD